MVPENVVKRTRLRAPKIACERKPIEIDAYYSIREISDPHSPYYVASSSTVFRALRNGDLNANYLGRAVRLKGSAIHEWLRGKGGGL
ncbi:MAG: hypothetical protein HONDAALG_00344 [Gammaproteobacteria bacterium]|nr:hypothetical protein [Gammaproteobacteria bacterium]